MRAKRIITVFLVVSMLFSFTPAVSENNDPIDYVHDVVDNFLAHLLPMQDIYSYSVPTSSNSIEIETQGVLIDETNNSVSLTGEINSITFFLADAAKLEQITGWVLYNIRLYENEGWSACLIHRKDESGTITDVSDKLTEYINAYVNAYEVQPMVSLTPRNDKWTHLYEGTVDMLIAWEMLNSYSEGFQYWESTQFPPGIAYLNYSNQYLLLITDYEKSFVFIMNSDETTLAIGLAILCALHANFYLGELSFYYMTADRESTKDEQNIYTEEISLDLQKGILSAIVEAISYEDGTIKIQLYEDTQ